MKLERDRVKAKNEAIEAQMKAMQVRSIVLPFMCVFLHNTTSLHADATRVAAFRLFSRLLRAGDIKYHAGVALRNT